VQESLPPLLYIAEQGMVRIGDKIVKLQGRQNVLMNYLYDNANRMYSYDEILDNVWGEEQPKIH